AITTYAADLLDFESDDVGESGQALLDMQLAYFNEHNPIKVADKEVARPQEVEDDLSEPTPIFHDGLPEPVALALVEWDDYCRSSHNSIAQFQGDYLTKVDVDGDGDEDWVLQGKGLKCIKNGRETSAGHGNLTMQVKVFQVTTVGTFKVVDDL